MGYRCIDLISSQLLKGTKVLAGDEKMGNFIRWCHCAELSETIDRVMINVKSGDLMLILGPILKDAPEDNLEALVNIAVEKSLAGVLIYKKDYLEKIPAKVVRIGKKANLPLMFIEKNQPPSTDLVCEITYGIMNSDSNKLREQNLLYDIIVNDIQDTSAMLARARFHKINLSIPHQAMCINFRQPRFKSKFSSNSNTSVATLILSCCEKILYRYYEKFLMISLIDNFICLIPENNVHVPPKKIAEQIMDELAKANHQPDVVIGIGQLYESLPEFRRSIVEAQQQCQAMRTLNLSNEVRTAQQMLVPLFLINHLKDPAIKQIHDSCISPLLESDQSSNSDLLKTLDVFLKCDKNISEAATNLFVHRNTLKNRLKRIEQLTEKKLENTEDCFTLSLALYIHKLSTKTTL